MSVVRIERARRKGYDDGYAHCTWKFKQDSSIVGVRFRMNVNGVVTCEHGTKCPGARSESPDCKLVDIIAGLRDKIHKQRRRK